MPDKPTIPPYQFVPVAADKIAGTRLAPVWHHQLPQPHTYTGELYCSGYALTPLLAGNEQVKYETNKDLKEVNRDGIKSIADYLKDNYPPDPTDSQTQVKPEHKIIRPFRFPTSPASPADTPSSQIKEIQPSDDMEDEEGGRFGIPSSQLKGLLSQAIGALTSAPMERVNERSFSFRPNVQFPSPGTSANIPKPGIGLLLGEIGGTCYVLLLDINLGRLRGYFKREDLSTLLGQIRIAPAAFDAWLSTWRSAPSINPIDIAIWLNSLGSSEIPFDSGGGLDGGGEFARVFALHNPRFSIASLKRTVLVPLTDLVGSAISTNILEIPAEFVQLYENTLEHLETDHIKHHPHQKKIDSAVVTGSIEKTRNMLAGRLIFLEYVDIPGNNKEIVSCGFNFRYRWRYRDTVKHTCQWNGTEWQENIRLMFDIRAEEGQPREDAKLTPRRRLFGFVKQDGGKADKDKLNALAGRINISYAVHQEDTGAVTGPAALKILGSPKPSAVEFYLTQSGNCTRSLMDYGDTGRLALHGAATVGQPRGRKFYLHQVQAAWDPSRYTIKRGVKPGAGSDQSATASSLLVPNRKATAEKVFPHFKFTVRFQNLEAHELGLLLLTLHLGNHQNHVNELLDTPGQDIKKSAFFSQTGTIRAHKLGHGQSLGLGSFLIAVDKLNLLNGAGGLPSLEIKSEKEMEEIEKDCRQALAGKLKEWFGFALPSNWQDFWEQGHLRDLANILHFRRPQRGRIQYPHKLDRDQKPCIFTYHSHIRNNHFKNRRGHTETLECLPPATEVWITPLLKTDCDGD